MNGWRCVVCIYPYIHWSSIQIKNSQIIPFAATWMEWEIIVLNKVSQQEKDKYHVLLLIWASQVALVVKNPPAKKHRRLRFSPWVRKIPWRKAWQPTPKFLRGESHGQRGSWRATVDSVAKSQTWLKRLSMHTHITYIWNLEYGTNGLIHKTQTDSEREQTFSCQGRERWIGSLRLTDANYCI